MRANAARMEAAVAFVTAHPAGIAPRAVIGHLLELIGRPERPTVYKQAASVVDRVIRDRLVRQAPNQVLYAWDRPRKEIAEALERALFAVRALPMKLLADELWEREVLELTTRAWRAAGDENRARVLDGLSSRERGDTEAPAARRG